MAGVARHAAGTALGLLADRILGEPPDRWHPVAWFGTLMQAVEQRWYADSRLAGMRHTGVGVATGIGAGVTASLVTRPVLGRTAATAAAVGLASSGQMLRDVAFSIETALRRGDLDAARGQLPALVGRDPRELDESGIAAAVIESLAENTVDAVVAPAWWSLWLGAPGALGHRAANTLDAMVGHRNDRYQRFGWASARLDDVLAWLPARLTAALVMSAAPHRADEVWRVVGRDAPAHPSPNAGVAEAAVAAALGVRLGGPLRYGDRVEDRPVLGDGPRPVASDIARARHLMNRVELMLLVALLWTATRKEQRCH